MVLNTISKAVKERRKELGITQPLLGELAGVSKNTIYKLERGSGNPTIKVLEGLLEVLGLELRVEIKKVGYEKG